MLDLELSRRNHVAISRIREITFNFEGFLGKLNCLEPGFSYRCTCGGVNTVNKTGISPVRQTKGDIEVPIKLRGMVGKLGQSVRLNKSVCS